MQAYLQIYVIGFTLHILLRESGWDVESEKTNKHLNKTQLPVYKCYGVFCCWCSITFWATARPSSNPVSMSLR